jgi:hypothetical protein
LQAEFLGRQNGDRDRVVAVCRNIAVEAPVAEADRHAPGPIRAPPDTPYMFALECGMDELTYAWGASRRNLNSHRSFRVSMSGLASSIARGAFARRTL